jgi:hypothetical protein
MLTIAESGKSDAPDRFGYRTQHLSQRLRHLVLDAARQAARRQREDKGRSEGGDQHHAAPNDAVHRSDHIEPRSIGRRTL